MATVMAGSSAHKGNYRKQQMTVDLAKLTLSEDLLEAVRAAKANGLSDYVIREQLLDYAGGPR